AIPIVIVGLGRCALRRAWVRQQVLERGAAELSACALGRRRDDRWRTTDRHDELGEPLGQLARELVGAALRGAGHLEHVLRADPRQATYSQEVARQQQQRGEMVCRQLELGYQWRRSFLLEVVAFWRNLHASSSEDRLHVFASWSAWARQRQRQPLTHQRDLDLARAAGDRKQRQTTLAHREWVIGRADPGLDPREHLVGTTEVAIGRDQQPTERVMGPHVVVPAQVRREPLRHLIDVEEAVLVEQLLVQVAVE